MWNKKQHFPRILCCRGNSESGGSRPGSSQRPGSDEGLPEIPDPSAPAQNSATQNQMEQSQPVSIIPLASASVTGSVILVTSPSVIFHTFSNYSFKTEDLSHFNRVLHQTPFQRKQIAPYSVMTNICHMCRKWLRTERSRNQLTCQFSSLCPKLSGTSWLEDLLQEPNPTLKPSTSYNALYLVTCDHVHHKVYPALCSRSQL